MKKILVIEDQMQLLRNIETILEMEGYEVCAYSNPLLALESWSRERPDMVLCDITMPDLDGFELLQKFRETEAFQSIPFVFMTARSERRDQRKGMSLGADDYLTKPVSREELLDVVQTRLERRSKMEALQKASSSEHGFNPDFSDPKKLESGLNLTPRESEVLLWVAQGKSNGDIAVILQMAEKTVKKHMTHIFEKLGVEGRNAATIAALEVLADPNK